MGKFARTFPVEVLAQWDAEHPGNLVRLLFQRWAMPGRRTNRAPLRIGVRDGYVNFYIQGQLVAKLYCGRARPTVLVHQTYVDERTSRFAVPSRALPRQPYISFLPEALARTGGSELIASWITTAETHASAEKRFVDDLIGSNSGVLDFEMGLPAGGQRNAPRTDLIVAQGQFGGPYSIAFWEVKCSINPELRARAAYVEANGKRIAGPKVIHQLRKCQQWMSDHGRQEEFQRACKATAEILLGFYRVFGSKLDVTPDCVRIWEALVKSPLPNVVLPPGLVVGNYCPGGYTPTTRERASLFRNRADSFVPHAKVLENHGVMVHQSGPDHHGRYLPQIANGEVTAEADVGASDILAGNQSASMKAGLT